MEVLNLVRLFWGWIFPCISRIHTASKKGEDSSILGTWNVWRFLWGWIFLAFLLFSLQALKQKVDDEVKRIVDEQYQRGMTLLRVPWRSRNGKGWAFRCFLRYFQKPTTFILPPRIMEVGNGMSPILISFHWVWFSTPWLWETRYHQEIREKWLMIDSNEKFIFLFLVFFGDEILPGYQWGLLLIMSHEI